MHPVITNRPNSRIVTMLAWGACRKSFGRPPKARKEDDDDAYAAVVHVMASSLCCLAFYYTHIVCFALLPTFHRPIVARQKEEPLAITIHHER